MTKTSPGPGTDHGLIDIAVIGGGINGTGIARDAADAGVWTAGALHPGRDICGGLSQIS